MRHKMILSLSLLLAAFVARGQVHHLNFTYTTPPSITAGAGNDFTVTCGAPFVLQGSITGGTAPFFHFWQPGGLLNDSTLLNPTGNIGQMVTFTLYVADSSGCIASDEVTVNCTPNSMEEWFPEALRIYPNPTTGKFFIEWAYPKTSPIEVICYTALGRVLWTKHFHDGSSLLEIDPETTVPGIYFLQLTSGDFSVQQKFVIR